MEKEFSAITDGTFTLQEGENENQFYFYRNDGEVLTEIDSQPMDLYQAYIMCKMMDAKADELSVSCKMHLELSESKKTMRLTVEEIREEQIAINSIPKKRKPNFLKRFIKKILG